MDKNDQTGRFTIVRFRTGRPRLRRPLAFHPPTHAAPPPGEGRRGRGEREGAAGYLPKTPTP